MSKTIYLAGGCYWGVQKYIDQLPGILETQVGFANGTVEAPTYKEVCGGDTGHTETCRVVYDETVLSLKVLLHLFFRIIDPTQINRQGHDVGYQYRTGIFYQDPEDLPVIQTMVDWLQTQYEAPLALAVEPCKNFYPAEEDHQKYLDKRPGGYCHVPLEQILWARSLDLDNYIKENEL